jgi:osmotically-inducible protein OsmY
MAKDLFRKSARLIMKKELRIQHDIIQQLKKDLSFYSSQIGVAVKNAMVLVSGVTDTRYRKTKAINAAKRVSGVKAVAADIQVDDSPGFGRIDLKLRKRL